LRPEVQEKREMRVTVYGLWHLGCVTAACLAEAGDDVVGLDLDEHTVTELQQGRPPLHEPGLEQLIAGLIAKGNLSFSHHAAEALQGTGILWIAFDTPVDDQDQADLAFLRARLEAIADFIPRGTLVVLSSQVPVGFTRSLQEKWHGRGLRYAYSPENLRLGKALDSFRKPERVVVGLSDQQDQPLLNELFAPFCSRIEWMSIESAEMTKHALNAFLAASVAFINELARLCEATGADAKEVERGLKSEGRIGPRAYLSPGAAFAGGTLARDVRFLVDHGLSHDVSTPFMRGVLASNEDHKGWIQRHVERLIGNDRHPVVAVLGLTYKPGTSTLRRSASIELCRWLNDRGIRVRGHDPAVRTLPDELQSLMKLEADPLKALDGADLAIVATEWADYRALRPVDICERMRRPRVIDPNHHLANELGNDSRINYIATGRGVSPRAAA
jgi:UDPglucose 6-dehydrogenase